MEACVRGPTEHRVKRGNVEIMLAGILILLATAAAVFAQRHEDAPPRSRMDWIRVVAYSLFTVVVAFEMAAGAFWDLLHIEYVRVILTRLGYPMYLLDILGVWRIPCALVLLVPRFPRLKEWAYAGAIFNYTGAAASHLLAGNGPGHWVGPLIFAAFTIVSWALRPAGRRLVQSAPPAAMRAVAWAVPILIVVAMSAVALMTLPKGPPPA